MHWQPLELSIADQSAPCDHKRNGDIVHVYDDLFPFAKKFPSFGQSHFAVLDIVAVIFLNRR